MSRANPRPPRTAFASRRLSTVPAGRPTVLVCVLVAGVLAGQAVSETRAPVGTQLGTAKPRWHVPSHTTTSRRWEIHGPGAALVAAAADTQ